MYLRQRSFENENYLFQYKIDQYTQLIAGASGLIELMHQSFADIRGELEETFPEDDEIDVIAGEIDEQFGGFRILLQKSCAFIPKEIVAKLDVFYNRLFEVQTVLDKEVLKDKRLAKSLDELDELEESLEVIVNLMRKDLGIEAIDLKLKKRTA